MRPALSDTPADALRTSSQLWTADQLGQADAPTLATGHAVLDAQLPGGGWPLGALVEVLQDFAGQLEWQLLLPALAARVRQHPGPVVLVGAPYLPFTPALAMGGVPAERWLWVDAPRPDQRLWACEQALRCTEVAAVLAWLPAVQPSALRRLHLAAQAQGPLLFALRGTAVQGESTPASLRLRIGLAPASEQMQVHLLKRRGPPLLQPLMLPARFAPLAAVLAASHARRALPAAPARAPAPRTPAPGRLPAPLAGVVHRLPAAGLARSRHAMDRASSA